MFKVKNLIVALGLLVGLSSCGAIAHIFYNPKDICRQDKKRKGKFKDKHADKRGKATK